MPIINTPISAAHTSVQAAAEVVDALYRFAAGQDLQDEDLFRSAWAADAELDFVQPAARLGVTLPPFAGRDLIVQSILGSLQPLVTTHTVTNPRVTIEGEGASLFALVEAQHISKADPHRRLLLKNLYDCALAREDGLWRIRRMRILNAWLQGDPQVLFPAA